MNAAANRLVKGCAGFTLLELLVSLALMALIMTYLSSSISTGRRAWETAQSLEDPQTVEAVRRFVSQRLAQSMPLLVRLPNSQQAAILFDGRSAAVSFVSTVTGHTEVAGIYRFELSLDKSRRDRGGLGSLVVSQTVLRTAKQHDAVGAAPVTRTLLGGVVHLKFLYFGAPKNVGSPVWHGTWQDPNSLPSHIAVEVEFDGRNTRRWPRLVVRLPLSSGP